jgi:glycosyltransferase involved in cell wall biosynthesis
MAEKYPLVSILTASYNSERFIRTALDSALAQTYPNFEIIFIDDGSTDGTRDIVKGYAVRDKRIHYFEQENMGILRTRNAMLEKAQGEFITYLDHDDMYAPNKVKREVEFLQAHPEDAAVYCNYYCFFNENPEKNYLHVYPLYEGQIFEPLLDKIFIANTTFMMRSSVVKELGPYNPATGMVEDWEYFLRMSRHGMLFGLIQDRLARIRIRDDSSTRFENQPKIQSSVVKIFEQLNDWLTPEERLKYGMEHRLWVKRMKLGAAELGAENKEGFYEAWHSAWQNSQWRWLVVPLGNVVVAILPAGFLAWAVRRAAIAKKAGVTIPA